MIIQCVIYNTSLWLAVVEDIEVTVDYVHITNSEEVTLELIHKKEVIITEVTKGYYKLNIIISHMAKELKMIQSL